MGLVVDTGEYAARNTDVVVHMRSVISIRLNKTPMLKEVYGCAYLSLDLIDHLVRWHYVSIIRSFSYNR